MSTSREVQWVVGEGESYGLVFSFMAVQALKDKWGAKNDQAVIAEMQTRLQEGLDIQALVDILWAATRSKHREVTPERVLEILDAKGFEAVGEINELLTRLMAASFPQAQPGGDANPPKLAS